MRESVGGLILDDPFVPASHRKNHQCGEDEGFLPVVNSPRMGMCGYIGES